MKTAKSIIIVLGLALTYLNTETYAQSFNTETCIAEVYGSVAEELPAESLAWLEACLLRCSVIESSELGTASYSTLESVPLNDKYGATLSYDLSYDAATFNPLKYQFNFHRSVDQYFRIGSSDFYLKIEANP